MSRASVRALACVLSLSMFAACTTDPYTGERQVAKTAIGAAIGSAAGAGIGALADRKNRARGALIGAGAGALAGGAVGGYMDYQEHKLRQRLQGTGVSVTRVGNEIVLNMPGNITFASDQDAIKADFFDVLNSVVLVVKEYDKTIIQITGHTDSTGSDAHNLDLSKRRAASVGSYLRSQGVNQMRIITEGFGEQYPIADNATPEGRAQNRRVELRLSPLTA